MSECPGKGRGIPPRSKEELLWAAQALDVISATSGFCDRVTTPPSCLVGRRSWFLFTFLAKHTFAAWFMILGGCFCEWLRAPGFVPFKADCLSLENRGSVCRAKLWVRIFRSWRNRRMVACMEKGVSAKGWKLRTEGQPNRIEPYWKKTCWLKQVGRVFILFGLRISYGIRVFLWSFKNCVFQVAIFDCQAPVKVGEDLFYRLSSCSTEFKLQSQRK